MARENFYLILELSFDPLEEDSSVIEAAIEKKRIEWSKGATDFKKGIIYRNYSALLPEIRRVMADRSLRRKEGEEAKRITIEKITHMLTIVAKRGFLYESEAKNMAKKCRCSIEIIKQACHLKIVPDSYTEEILPKPEGTDKFKVCEVYLDALNKSDYYDFINTTGHMERLREMPVARLKQLIKQRKVVVQKNTPEESAIDKLCAECEKTFQTEQSKAEYDEYLVWKQVQTVFHDVLLATEVTRQLDALQGEEAVRLLQRIVKDEKKSRALLKTYCKQHGIAWIETATKAPTQVLPKDKPEKPIKPIKLERPEKPVRPCVGEKKVETRVPVQQKEVTIFLTKVNENVAEKKYYQALQEFFALKKVYPRYENPSLEAEISLPIEKAAQYIKEAKQATNEKEIIAYCGKALEACKDHPEVVPILEKYPPLLQGNVMVTIDSSLRRNEVRWSPGNQDDYVRYAIVRKREVRPVSINDGELLATVATTEYIDSTMYPGTTYYYTVFATRFNAYSKGISSTTPAVNFFEVEEPTIQSRNKEVEVRWKKIPTNAYVEVYKQIRRAPERIGDGMLMKHVSQYGFLDTSVENDVLYAYRIYCVYVVGGKKIYSAGVTLSATPTAPPMPVNNMEVLPREAYNQFDIKWEASDSYEVEFYYQLQVPSFTKGQVVMVEELRQKARKLFVHLTKKGTGYFTVEEGKTYFLFAVTKKGEVAVVGAMTNVANIRGVQISGVECVNQILHLYCDWPELVKYIDILYRFDDYPVDINDPKAKRQRITKKLYEQSKSLRIDGVSNMPYYMKVFSEIPFEGGIQYSRGTNVFFNNIEKYKITYNIQVKHLLLRPNKVEVTFEAKDPSFLLPEVLLVIGKGYPPAFPHSGTQVALIPSCNVTGTYTYRLTWKDLEENLYMKAFLKNKEDEQKYELLLKYKGRSKLE